MGPSWSMLLVLFTLVLLHTSTGQERPDDWESEGSLNRQPAPGEAGFDLDKFAADGGIEDPFGGGEWRDEHDERFGEEDDEEEGGNGGDHDGDDGSDDGGDDGSDDGSDDGGDDSSDDGSDDGSDDSSDDPGDGGCDDCDDWDDDDDNIFADLFQAPGVIINDFTFDDAVNVFGDAARADTILQSVGVVCDNRNRIGIELPVEVDEVCGLVGTALGNNQPVTGIEEFCDGLITELFGDDEEDGDGGDGRRKRRNTRDDDGGHDDGHDDGHNEEEGRGNRAGDFFFRELSMKLSLEFGDNLLESEGYCNGLASFIDGDSRSGKDITDTVIRLVVSVALEMWSPRCGFYNGSREDWDSSRSLGSFNSTGSSDSLGSFNSTESSDSSGYSDSLGSSDSWGSSDDFGDIDVDVILALISGYNSSHALCEHVSVNQSDFSQANEELITNVTNYLINLAYNEDECNRVAGDVIFPVLVDDDDDEASASNMTAELCSMLVGAFGDNSTGGIFVGKQDIVDYILELGQMFNSSSPGNYSEGPPMFNLTLGANNTNDMLLRWYSVFDTSFWGPYAAFNYLRPDQFIQIFGRMYNAQNAGEAFTVLCDSLSPEIRGPDLNEMCESASNRQYDDVREVCSYWGYYGLVELFDWDAYWEVFYLDWYLEEWDRQQNETWYWFKDGVRWPVLGEFELDWNPFDLCKFFGEEIVKTPNQVEDDIYRGLERVVLRAINSLIYEPCDVIRNNRSSDFVNNFGNDQPEPKSINDYTLSLLTYVGGFDAPSAFCTSMYDINDDWEFWNIKIDHIRGLLDIMKENVELVATDEETCGEFVSTLTDFDPQLSIPEWTGFADADSLCVALVDATQGDGPPVEWSSLLDAALNAESAGSSELPPGFLMDGLPLKIVLSSLGTIWNSETVIEGMAVVCDNLVPLVEELTGLDSNEINDLCGALRATDIKAVRQKCEVVAVPYFYGEHYPTSGMAELDGDAVLRIVQDVLGWESFEQEGICPGIESLLNADFSFIDLIITMLQEVIPFISTESALPFCRNKDQIKAYWQRRGPFYDESSSDYDERLRDAPRPHIEYDLLDPILGVVTGIGSIDRICDALLEADEAGEASRFYDRVIDGLFSLVSNVDRCTVGIKTMLDVLLPELEDTDSFSVDVDEVPWADPVYWATGERTPRAVCTRIVLAYTAGQEVGCRGIVDCAGTCNGNAFVNNCTECVGGRTGRAVTFGMDRCGLCRKARGYSETWDCYGTCDGTAVVDRCGECVGGSTGQSRDANDGRLDCRGVCDGGWVADTCNYCEPPAKQGVVYDGGSKYKDCTGSCVRPGFPRAQENDCGACWGGSSGLDETEGVNVCGQCESSSVADVNSCAGCDGVPASGIEYDACGVCGGDGTNCVAVGVVLPNIVPNVETRVRVAGAGFTAGASLTCLFTRSGQTTEGAAARIDTTLLWCEVPVLTPGDYEVSVRRNSDLPSEITSTLRVFQDVEVLSISPTTFTVNRSVENVEITVTVATGALAFLRAYSAEWNVLPTLSVFLDNGFLRSYSTFDSDETMTFLLDMPFDSGSGIVVPSVNYGATALGQYSVNGYAYFQAPTLENIQFSDSGATLLVTFDMPVDYENLRSCRQMFNSVEMLGVGARCLWLYPTAMLILIGKGNNLVEIGTPMAVKPDALKAFRQDFSHSVESTSFSVRAPDNPVQPEAIVTGPPKLPSCGDIRIDARRSRGSGGRDMSYYWEVASTGSTSALDSALNDINTNSPSASLSMDGDLMDADTDYVFTVNVTNFLGGSDLASLTVHRTGTAAPEVKILSSGVDLTSVRVSDSFELTAHIKFYSECVPPGETLFEWSVNNTDVALNLKTQYTRSLYVPTYSLPAGNSLTFTVRVYKSSNPSAYVEASMGAVTISSPLVAIIRGPSELTIGRDSGEVVLDGSLSYDPDEEAREWTYEWQCLQTDDNSACWSYDPSSIGTLINNGSNLDGAYLRFDALSLQADKAYTFTLVASKEARSASATVYVSVVNGNPPKIEIPPRPDNGQVKDNRPFFLSAIIRYSTELSNVTWETTDTGSGYGFLDFDDTSNLLVPATVFPAEDGVSAALLVVKAGVVSRGTSYSIRINATTVDGQTNSVKTYISVLSGPTSCDFVLPDNYTEFEEVTFSIENCVSEAEPLQYQLHVVKADGSVSAFKDTTPEPSFTSVGAPQLPSSNIRIYIMKVCDGNDICSFYEGNVTVLEKTSFTASEVTAYISDQVNTPKFAGDFSLALTNLNMVSDRGLVSRRRRRRTAAQDSTSDTTADQLELIQLTIDETVMTSSRAQLLLDQTESVDPTTMVLADQSDFVSYLGTLIDAFSEEDVPVPEASATTVSGKLDVISEGLDPVYHESLLSQISTVRGKLAASLASGLSVGSPRSEIEGTDGVSSVMRTLLSDPIDSTSSGTPISIDFGSEVAGLFGASWICSSGESCSGVTLKIQHYDTGVDLLSTDQDHINNRVADILDIELADPESDVKLNISGLTTKVQLGFTITNAMSEADYECVYWDGSTWSTYGLDTTDNGDGTFTCATDHLTTFTVMGLPWPSDSTTEASDTVTSVPEGFQLTTQLIIIIAASAALGLLVIVFIAVFICKYCGKKTKVSTTDLQAESQRQPQPQQPQLQLQPQMQQQPVVAVIGIPVVQGQYGMGYAQPMATAPIDNLPMYNIPTQGYSTQAGAAQPYSGTVATAPPRVTLVGQNNNLVEVGMAVDAPPSYSGKAARSSEMSSYVSAVTTGLPGVGGTEHIPMKAVSGSKASLTGHF
ncbi:uncharacterized protein LOC119721034 [Patiria miniata]|uniref:PKD/REJ-like domain-containing protein n=1 Tax=Patiria miniata TaxID=46514 RepID=A0A913Z511_PATMI|nr:uncharacterized protein LOC119721034 [Patiria miniata]